MSESEAAAEVATMSENAEDGAGCEKSKLPTTASNNVNIEDEIAMADRQNREIEEERNRQPLVGDKVPFESLCCEYNLNDSPEFYTKALDLCNSYEFIRNIRRDGNCFYRAILFAQVELMYSDPDERARFDSVCRGWHKRLIDLNFPEFTTTDFCEAFYEFLDTIIKGERTFAEQMAIIFLDDNQANYLILFLRLMASGYLREHEADFAPFIEGVRSFSEFCQMEIEAMWKDVDHLAIMGFVAAAGISIRVEYMDQSAAPDGGWHYDFPPDSASPPHIHLLYRPGHYDIIYPKS